MVSRTVVFLCVLFMPLVFALLGFWELNSASCACEAGNQQTNITRFLCNFTLHFPNH